MKKINGNIVSTLMCSFINFQFVGGASIYGILLMALNPSNVSQPLLGHQLPSELDFLNSPSFHCRCTGRERLIRSHSSARFCFELSGNSN